MRTTHPAVSRPRGEWLDRPLPRALPPNVDARLTEAVDGLDDRFARTGLPTLRGTGLLVGELLDLEVGAGPRPQTKPVGRERPARCRIVGGPTFTSVSYGSSHTCGLDAARQAWCWGWGEEGALGDGAGG